MPQVGHCFFILFPPLLLVLLVFQSSPLQSTKRQWLVDEVCFFFLWHHLVLSTALQGLDCVCARPPFLCVSVGLGDASAKAAKKKKTEVNHEPDTLPQPTPFFTFVLIVFFFFCVCACASQLLSSSAFLSHFFFFLVLTLRLSLVFLFFTLAPTRWAAT